MGSRGGRRTALNSFGIALDHWTRRGSFPSDRQRARRLRLRPALRSVARPHLVPVVVLVAGFRRHTYFRHGVAHLLRPGGPRAPASTALRKSDLLLLSGAVDGFVGRQELSGAFGGGLGVLPRNSPALWIS